MSWVLPSLWLIPVLPALAAGVIALAPRRCRRFASGTAIGSMGVSLVLSLAAFMHTVGLVSRGAESRQVFNFTWFQFGDTVLPLGWVLDPLSAVMLVMVCFVGILIFIYSLGYMAHDDNFTRFFCFLALFAGAMLGVVIANSLLLLFICWELVGLTSYLLIGFWFHRPTAAAAARKAFITTRVGDMAFLIGMVWLYAGTGTLLFYDEGKGCLETTAIHSLVMRATGLGMAASTGISLLIFLGAVGKSGQLPLHVWLPDAMEGPTPVSALIHAATMVAAGVFLVARVYPLMAVTAPETAPPAIQAPAVAGAGQTKRAGESHGITSQSHEGQHGGAPVSTALKVVTWTGVLTALFAASIAVAQTDIKRILAYSTVSQLGFMMMGLGAGGVAVGMFHLITHAFFKALLFMGAGSVIHGCHEEQDIRRMGGLKAFMPVTYMTYAVGMMALSGVPLLFSGFWSKDEILHAVQTWPVSSLPFVLGLAAALLTAFYMTRQMVYVFFGPCRLKHAASHGTHSKRAESTPHESPRVMTVPLSILAVFAVLLGFLGTPAWPWFQSFLEGRAVRVDVGQMFTVGTLGLIGLSTFVVFGGIYAGWRLYGRRPPRKAEAADPLEAIYPEGYAVLRNKYYIDELYDLSVVRVTQWCGRMSDWLDQTLWAGAVRLVSFGFVALSWLSRLFDEYVVNAGFDQGCRKLITGGSGFSRLQTGRVRHYLGMLALGFLVLVLVMLWRWRP